MYKQKMYLVLSVLISGESFVYSAQMSHSESKMCTVQAPGGPASPRKQKKTVRWAPPQIREVIEGNLSVVIDPTFPLQYYGYHTWPRPFYTQEGEKLDFKPSDVFVPCTIVDKGVHKSDPEQYDWDAYQLHGLDYFPLGLPLYLLDGKQEGDVVTFLVKNKKHDFVRIKLICNQLNSRASEKGDFAQALSFIKKNFARKPHFNNDDAAGLIYDRIIEKFGTTGGEIAYRHGPKGFKG
jgi:hypothetical protein